MCCETIDSKFMPDRGEKVLINAYFAPYYSDHGWNGLCVVH